MNRSVKHLPTAFWFNAVRGGTSRMITPIGGLLECLGVIAHAQDARLAAAASVGERLNIHITLSPAALAYEPVANEPG